MADHFCAFSFVDRITSLENGRRIRGRYTIPADVRSFPLALVGEAVGQLAAWAAMAATDFQQRPVAGLAGRIELQREVGPGQMLDLEANLEHVDVDSVQYCGTAHVAGALVVRLTDCVGPMMPIADFDAPEALRGRFEALRGPGAGTAGFPDLPPLSLERTGGISGQSVTADFHVPSEAPLFGDHFPRRPVFPGSLLMYVHLQLAAALAKELPQPDHAAWAPATIQDMKLRSFIAPGAHLRLQATLRDRSEQSAVVALETRSGTDVIATARLLLKPGGQG
jgi:3-hydroxymyristoyl/3-hydroxydecanoyl-(acyl carrier protein) dehydratase